MKKMKFLAIILAMVFMVVGCTEKEQSSTSKQEEASAINFDYINLSMVKPETINPILNKEKSVGYITNLIYDGLFTIDKNYNVVNQLVEEYGISANGNSINIKLKDAKWHDGSAVTSRDVSFTIDLIKRSTESPYNALVQNTVSSVSIINDKEFSIKFANKYAFSMDTLIFPIVNQKYLSSSNQNELLNYKNNLIGNGPYKIEKYEERDGITLILNEEYYEELPQNIKKIKVNVVPDEEAQVAMIMALQSDIGKISLNDLSKFQEKEFNITNYEGRDYEYLLFNYNNTLFRDVNFRKAIASAINKDKVLDEGYMGDATLVNFPLNSNSKYYDKSIKGPSYNKEKAKKYLEQVNPMSDAELQAQLNQENQEGAAQPEDNTNEKINDKVETDAQENLNKEAQSKSQNKKTKEEIKKMISELNLKIIVNKDNSERLKTAYVISENLKEIGIKSTVEQLSVEDIDKSLNEKTYDLAILGWELSSVPDATAVINSSGYSDEELNNYMSSLLNATSENQIKDIYKSIQKHVSEKVPFISLVIREDYIVTNRRLNGAISPNDFDVYEGISNLSIKNKK